MGFLDFITSATEKRLRAGRPRKVPDRETIQFPTLMNLGMRNNRMRYLYKPTPRNLRYFSHQPYARKAINAIKNPISMLEWQIRAREGITLNKELERQIEVATNCFRHPNLDDNFHTLAEQMVEDYLVGACALEMQLSGDPNRPLWLFPVDGLSIQIYPMWTGKRDEARYAQVVGYGTAFGGGTIAELRNDELIYIRPNGSSATPFGFGPLEIAFNSVNYLLGVSEFDGHVASNQRPSIWLDIGEGVTEGDLLSFREYWINEIEGQGKVPISGFGSSADRSDAKSKRGPSVIRLYPEGDDGMFLKYQEFLIRTVAASFDLSPQNFGIEKDVNRNTSEVAEDRDWAMAIKPCAAKIAQHLTKEAIQGKLGFSQLEFHWVGIDREDEYTTAQIAKMRYEANSLTPNEYRTKLGEPPIEGPWGDKVYADVEIAMQAARSAGQVDDPSLKPNAGSKSSSKGKK